MTTMVALPTFEELTKKPPSEKTWTEKLLMQCLVSLTGHFGFVGMTEGNIYDALAEDVRSVDFEGDPMQQLIFLCLANLKGHPNFEGRQIKDIAPVMDMWANIVNW